MRSVAALCLLAACCPEDVDDLSAYGERWQEADSLFHLDALDLLEERNARTLFYPHFVRVAFAFPAS